VYAPIVARHPIAKNVPRQRRIVGSIVYYTVSVVSKESRRLVLPRTIAYTEATSFLAPIQTYECPGHVLFI
jgi:hypothetical protein